MKKVVFHMVNGDELIYDNASFEELVNALDSKHIPKFLKLGKPGRQNVVNVKQIAYAKEVEE